MKETFLLLTMTLIPFLASGQLITAGESGRDKVDNSKIKPWISTQTQDYQSVYHFGFSDGESSFILIISRDSCYAQIIKGKWTSIGVGMDFVINYEILKNVRIQGNKFFSDKTNGEFVIYNWDNRETKGLVVYKPWSGNLKNGESEFGFRSHSVDIHYPGKFPFASWRILAKDELEKMGQSDLQLMHNEIYARYGFIFRQDDKMDAYFKTQSWYKGQHEDVTNFLTGLEKQNIELIQLFKKNINGL